MSRIITSLFLSFFFLSDSLAQKKHPQVDLVLNILADQDIAPKDIYITDHYTSKGITHTYYKQSIDGIPIYNSRGAIHQHNGQTITKHNFKKISKDAKSTSPSISALKALENIITTKGLNNNGEINVVKSPSGKNRLQTLSAPRISISKIESKLEYYIDEYSNLRLVWLIPIEHVSNGWFTNYLADAHTGDIIKEVDWTVACNHGSTHEHNENCNHKANHKFISKSSRMVESVAPNSYEVFPWPLESPNFGGRSSVASPWLDNTAASPNGWHTIGEDSYTTTRGNNTDTYIDDDNTNSPTGGDAARADGGATLDFTFPLDLNLSPTDYIEASITNTFYWTNLMHDVWYNYGFDEASGNFQEENYTPNGNGSDYVNSEAQDGSGTCNANFGTPPDGSNPRMQMYLCTMNGNFRDGDYDNGVIAHEYGHGISNRLTGGPAASGCLGNQEQMGEGWSDYLGMVMTIESGDSGPDSRGMGTWLFGEGPNGDGIRPFPYSTDFGVNPMTYNTINTVSVPHGVGSVWCTMLWDMTWLFINEYGFDPDIYNGTGGNNMAMELVMLGMKLQPCSPGFVDGRDAILEADQMINGGSNACIIWNAFATRGLGYSANQGSSGSRSDGSEAFDLPPSCSLSITKSTPTTSAVENDQITYTINIENNFPDIDLSDVKVQDVIPQELFFVSASDGGSESNGIIGFPFFDLSSGESTSRTVTLQVKTGLDYVVSDLYDDIENGTGNWTVTNSGSTNWATQTTTANSGTTSWFAPDNNTSGTATLDLSMSVGLGDGAELSFFHQYDTETAWDGGQVFVSTDSGSKWINLGNKMTLNGYNNTVFNSVPGFSGNSNGFINTIIDLDEYSGQNIIIRFQMNCDQAVGGNGWWIDDIAMTNLKLLTINEASVSSAAYSDDTKSNATEIIPPSTVFQAELTKSNVVCGGDNNGILQILPQGGSGSYTYLWDDGNTSQNRINLSGGLYRVTVSDGTDELIKVGIISEPDEIELSFIIENISNLDGNNGSLEVIPTGGNGEFSYLWSTGSTNNSISDLLPGIYTVTVTDQNNCFKIESAEVIKYGCGDPNYDSGGSNADYSNNEDEVVIICSDIPNEDVVLTFNSIDIEVNWDALYIHNGNSINSPLFASSNGATQAGYPAGGYYGTTAPGPFTASNESGCITLRFRSDQAVTGDGWDVDISCAIACADEVLNLNSDGYGSLKREVLCADPVDIINISSNIYLDTIVIDSTIIINKQLEIDPGTNNTVNIISTGNGPIFEIEQVGNLELNNTNIMSGTLDPGGAIINHGILKLKDVNIFENAANSTPNGLILNDGQLTIDGNSNIKKE